MSFDQNDPFAKPGDQGQPAQPPTYGAPGQQPAYGAGQPGAGQPAGMPAAPQYGAPAAPAPGFGAPGQGYAPVGVNPGKTMGLVGLILSALFCIPFSSLAGIIVSIVALVKSRKAGHSNGMALAGIIVGALVLIGGLVFWFTVGALALKCQELGPGTHFVDGVTYTCS
jgi:hypothetical protein